MDIERIFEKHPYWQDILEVIEKLQRAGFKTYLAGGCVRDGLLGVQPKDFDVATEARPDEITKIFPHVLDVGRQFGVSILPFKNHQVEIATFRYDGEYKDGRRPESVSFCGAEEDAKRRDFTVNALFYDIKAHQVIDYVSGLTDLRERRLRAVGDPAKRFTEDKLRMLRMARFAAQLGFEVDDETLAAMRPLAAEIKIVSRERITQEFSKFMQTRDPARGFVILKSSGLLKELFPDLSFIDGKLWPRFLSAIQILTTVPLFEVLIVVMVLFQWFEDTQNQKSNEIESVDYTKWPMVFSNQAKHEIDFLIYGFFVLFNGSEESLFLLNHDLGPVLTEIGFAFSTLKFLPEKNISEAVEHFLSVANKEGRLPAPLVTGEDLIRWGFKPSPRMGDIIKRSYTAQIKNEFKTKEEAQAWVLGREGS